MASLYLIDEQGKRYRKCKYPDCFERRHGGGYCSAHYQSIYRPSVVEPCINGDGRPGNAAFGLCSTCYQRERKGHLKRDLCHRCKKRNYIVGLGHEMCGQCWWIMNRKRTNTCLAPGTWDDDALLWAVKDWADNHDGYVPISTDWMPPPKDSAYPNATTIYKDSSFGSWTNFIDITIEKFDLKRPDRASRSDLKFTREMCFEKGIDFVNEYGFAPSKSEWKAANQDGPSTGVVIKHFGTWNEFKFELEMAE